MGLLDRRRSADTGDPGDEGLLELDDEERLVYEERVQTFVAWQFTLRDARALARGPSAKSDVKRLLRKGATREQVVRICA